MQCFSKVLTYACYNLNSIHTYVPYKQQFVTNFYFKGTQQFTGCLPNHDWLCHPWPPFV